MVGKKTFFKSLGLAGIYSIVASQSAFADTPTGSPASAKFDNGYMAFTSDDGNYQLKLDGRVQLDFGNISADKNPNMADTGFRRVRLGLKTKLWQEWEAEFDIDFAGEDVNVKDMWLAYTAVPGWNFKLGNFKPHFSIDQVTSSRVATFLESSVATDAIAPSRRIGFAGDYTNEYLFVGAGFFGDKVNDAADLENKDNPDGADQAERFGHSLRAVVRPFQNLEADRVVHFGFNYLNQKPRTIGAVDRKDDSFKFSVVSENELDETEYLDTGRMYGAESATSLGLEVVGKCGKHVVISEYLKTTVSFDDTYYSKAVPDAQFDGYYVAYSYFLSGDRKYDTESAEFAGVTGHNAIEFTARISNADFNDETGGNTKKRSANGAKIAPTIGVHGGQADITTLGVNWYPNPNLMLRADYIMVDLDKDADANGGALGNDTMDILGLRAQFTF